MVSLWLVPSLQEQGVTEVFCAFRCSVDNFIIVWLILSAAFKVLIHLPAIVLAFLTRRVKVDALNDYKPTLAIIHISTVLNVLLMVTLFAFATFQNAAAVSSSTLIFLNSMFFLGLTFIPKVSWIPWYVYTKMSFTFFFTFRWSLSTKTPRENAFLPTLLLPLPPETLSNVLIWLKSLSMLLQSETLRN